MIEVDRPAARALSVAVNSEDDEPPEESNTKLKSKIDALRSESYKLSSLHQRARVNSELSQDLQDTITKTSSNILTNIRLIRNRIRSLTQPNSRTLLNLLIEATTEFKFIQSKARQNYKTQMSKNYQKLYPGATDLELQNITNATTSQDFKEAYTTHSSVKSNVSITKCKQVWLRCEQMDKCEKELVDLLYSFDMMCVHMDEVKNFNYTSVQEIGSVPKIGGVKFERYDSFSSIRQLARDIKAYQVFPSTASKRRTQCICFGFVFFVLFVSGIIAVRIAVNDARQTVVIAPTELLPTEFSPDPS